MASPKKTPMLEQYLSIKKDHEDAILFFRMGDFFEMFFEDAKTAADVLDITLTSRHKADDIPIPMCGVPVRAAPGHISKLVDHGLKVAVCDQVEDASKSKGIVKREVTRIVTPGMVFDDEFLDEKTNNFIIAIGLTGKVYGLASLDISTGTFRITESKDIQLLLDEAKRMDAKEIVLPGSWEKTEAAQVVLLILDEVSPTYAGEKEFEFAKAKKLLLERLNTVTLEGFGCAHMKAAISAAGALLFYVKETQKQDIDHLTSIEAYTLGGFLNIDETSFRNLELHRNLRTGSRIGTLIGVIDGTVTSMGARLLGSWLRYPLKDHIEISNRLDAVGEAKTKVHERRNLRNSLKAIRDIERIETRICMGRCTARDLTALKDSLRMLPEIWMGLADFSSSLLKLDRNLDELNSLAKLIDSAIRNDAPPTLNEGGIIKKGFSSELDEIIELSTQGKGFLVKLEAEEKEKTGINSLKVRFNKVFGYYIEVPKSRAEATPPHYVRKQTLVNAERYITDELKQFEEKVLNAEEKRATLEYSIFCEIREHAASKNEAVRDIAGFIAQLDCLLCFAHIAEANGYVRPQINTEGQLSIIDGRHPVVEKLIVGERFVPNTIEMDTTENQILIITGPNMAGKSTVLRQMAIIVIMAQMGSFVPATQADIALTDRIFTRVGALDNLSSGQSTFMVEMEETANILNNATGDSLVIMDEIGRGTSTFDGLSLAWAVAEYLHDLKGKGVKTLFATHYHELTELAEVKPRVKNFNIAVKEWNDEIIFLRELVEGGTNRSYGIQVARLAGIPAKVVNRAKKVLAGIEKYEHGINGLPRIPGGEAPGTLKRKQKQLQLFQSPEFFIVDKLKKIDVETMTPIEAITWLSELKEKAESI